MDTIKKTSGSGEVVVEAAETPTDSKMNNSDRRKDDEEEEEEDEEDKIVEKSYNSRFHKRNKRFPKQIEGVHSAYIAIEPKTAKEFIWNEYMLPDKKTDRENRYLSLFKKVKKTSHPFLVRFLDAWIPKPDEKPRKLVFITERLDECTLKQFLCNTTNNNRIAVWNPKDFPESIPIDDRIKTMLARLENPLQRNFIETCLDSAAASRCPIKRLIDHPAVREVPTLKLLSATKIVQTTKMACRETGPEHNCFANLLKDNFSHLEDETVIVEIVFPSDKVTVSRLWKNFRSNFTLTTKFLEDVKNGFYPLFGCRWPWLAYQTDDELDPSTTAVPTGAGETATATTTTTSSSTAGSSASTGQPSNGTVSFACPSCSSSSMPVSRKQSNVTGKLPSTHDDSSVESGASAGGKTSVATSTSSESYHHQQGGTTPNIVSSPPPNDQSTTTTDLDDDAFLASRSKPTPLSSSTSVSNLPIDMTTISTSSDQIDVEGGQTALDIKSSATNRSSPYDPELTGAVLSSPPPPPPTVQTPPPDLHKAGTIDVTTPGLAPPRGQHFDDPSTNTKRSPGTRDSVGHSSGLPPPPKNSTVVLPPSSVSMTVETPAHNQTSTADERPSGHQTKEGVKTSDELDKQGHDEDDLDETSQRADGDEASEEEEAERNSGDDEEEEEEEDDDENEEEDGKPSVKSTDKLEAQAVHVIPPDKVPIHPGLITHSKCDYLGIGRWQFSLQIWFIEERLKREIRVQVYDNEWHDHKRVAQLIIKSKCLNPIDFDSLVRCLALARHNCALAYGDIHFPRTIDVKQNNLDMFALNEKLFNLWLHQRAHDALDDRAANLLRLQGHTLPPPSTLPPATTVAGTITEPSSSVTTKQASYLPQQQHTTAPVGGPPVTSSSTSTTNQPQTVDIGLVPAPPASTTETNKLMSPDPLATASQAPSNYAPVTSPPPPQAPQTTIPVSSASTDSTTHQQPAAGSSSLPAASTASIGATQQPPQGTNADHRLPPLSASKLPGPGILPPPAATQVPAADVSSLSRLFVDVESLVPFNAYCARCDQHDYAHRTDLPAYLISPCYHCREELAREAKLPPEVLLDLHLQHNIPWPGFLQARFNLPLDGRSVEELISYDCRWRSRQPCRCFSTHRILPPCVEFAWLCAPTSAATCADSPGPTNMTGIADEAGIASSTPTGTGITTTTDTRDQDAVKSPPLPAQHPAPTPSSVASGGSSEQGTATVSSSNSPSSSSSLGQSSSSRPCTHRHALGAQMTCYHGIKFPIVGIATAPSVTVLPATTSSTASGSTKSPVQSTSPSNAATSSTQPNIGCQSSTDQPISSSHQLPPPSSPND